MGQSIAQALKQPITLRAGLHSVCAWWLRHAVIALDAITPQYFKERLLEVDVTPCADGLHFHCDGASALASGSEDIAGSVSDALHGHPAWQKVDRVTGILKLLPDHIVRKRIALPAAAKDNLRDAVGYQIDIETPFRSSEVYYGARVLAETSTTLALEISVALRSAIDPLIAKIEAAGLSVENVYGCQSPNDPSPVLLLARPSEKPAKGRRQILLIGTLVASLLMAGIIAPLASAAFEAERLGSRAASDIQSAAPVIATQRKLAEQLEGKAAVAKVLQRFPDPVQVLASLTQSIPKDTWLTRLAMRGGEIQVSGLTPSTSILIDELARTDMFYPPSYAAPAIRDPQFDRERFVLNIKLRPSL